MNQFSILFEINFSPLWTLQTLQNLQTFQTLQTLLTFLPCFLWFLLKKIWNSTDMVSEELLAWHQFMQLIGLCHVSSQG